MPTGTVATAEQTGPHLCSSCDFSSPRWFGRCPDCGDWSSAISAESAASAAVVTTLTAPAADVRWPLGIDEVDRVLGGGLVPGVVILLAGEPGIGKSTLVLQLLAALEESGVGTLLCTGEESLAQVGMRAARIGGGAPGLRAVATDQLDAILSAVRQEGPKVVVVDSIQTVQDPQLEQPAGSPTQVRAAAGALAAEAKRSGTAMILVGHVTKDGNVAGPKTLEHMVDVLLALEGERAGDLRMLRSLKNRFGSCDETGIFLMAAAGLDPVGDPSAFLLADRCSETPGSVVLPTLEGSRPVLIEIQALISGPDVENPRRITTGLDARRADLVLGVLSGRGDLRIPRRDVYLAASGGMSVKEPAADLALAVALASTVLGVAVGEDVVAMGEIGLAGEVRRVPAVERRLKEAERLGFRTALVPHVDARVDSRLTTIPVRHVSHIQHFIMEREGASPARQAGGVVSSGDRTA